ncbi:MAG: acyl-CoA thioesterase [Flavobacteriales bacterium]|nr:acyl-CoA thioesterase [Flavobacteriales bacterium]
MKELINTTTFRVRFSEVDSLRIVWHGNFLKYFEDGRDAWAKEFDFDFMEVYEKQGLLMPLASSHMDYKYPLRYNEIGLVETTFVDSPAAKMIFRFKVYNEDKTQLKATGETVQVFMDTDHVLQLNTPPFFEEWKRKMQLL